MTINMRRKISRLTTNYYKARGLGMMCGIFDKYPEANAIDKDIFRVFGILERIGFDNPRGHLEKDWDYQYRLRKVYSKHEGSINSGIEKLYGMIDEVSTPKSKQEAEN
jgi:hypothetical protein